jgi:alkylhydroperoxidase family enzyme
MSDATTRREAFIRPPDRMPFFLRAGIWFAECEAGQTLLPARLLAWYPRAAFSSGILEALIADGRRDLNPRLLQLVRLQTSLAVACPFCIEMNSAELEANAITAQVNYWTRLIQALGIPRPGFSDQCAIPVGETAQP